MKIRHKTGLFAATSALALIMAGAANAQALPPEHYTLDPRGVDLISGQWHPVGAALSIGPADTGLSYNRFMLANGTWWDSSMDRVASCGIGVDCTVSIDGVSESFTPVSAFEWDPKENTGSSLTLDLGTSLFTYTRSDGTVYVISQQFGFGVLSKTTPNGVVTTYNYSSAEGCLDFDEEGNCIRTGIAGHRLQSYTTNTGYQIHLEYLSNGNADDMGYSQLKKVTAINNAVDYCSPIADVCTGLSRTWSSVDLVSGQSSPYDQVFTDQDGVETRYQYSAAPTSGNTLTELLVGTDPDPLITVERDGNGEVVAVTDATGAWNYDFDVSGSTLTTTVEGPLGQEMTVVTDLTVGRAGSVTQKTGPSTERTWDYSYIDGRLAYVEDPEGAYTDFDYDDRGNVIEVVRHPKPGSGLASITTSTAYPSTCANPVTCNLPTSTTDANGGVTDYSWDSAHGGLLSVTAPAPTTGAARPQTRISYAAQTAQIKNSAGVIVAAPFSVILPVEVSTCATGSSCDGAANEVLTTLDYGAPGVASNLQVASVARGSGATPNMAVMTMTYAPEGQVQTVDGPLPGTADTTRYRYDSQRRLIGVVGPDPDGVGPGLNRARRITYGEHDQVLSTEVGTTAGYSDSDWIGFDPILKTTAAYDDYDRPVEVRQMSDANVVSSVQQTTYDAAGRPSCVALRMNPATWGALPSSACTAATEGVNGPDRIVQMTYDVLGRPLSTTSAYGTADAVTESVTYGVNGQVASLTDGQGNVSVMEYDGFNRPSKLRYPNATGGGTSTTDYEQTAYDNQGRVYSVRNRAGDTTYFGYDALNRTIAVNAPGSTPDISSGYDNLGRMTVTGNGTITVATTWDALSRPVSEASSAIGAMSYAYDEAGRMTKMKWPDNFAANYTHDVYGAITAISQQPSGGATTQVAAYSWNDLGQPVGVSRAAGVGATTAWSYDAWGRMTGLSHDASGTSNDVAFGYSYNPAGQIVGRTVSNASYLHSASPTGATAYVVDGQNQLDTIDSVAVTHDSRGNVTGILGRTYGYDDLNRLTSASAGAGAATFAFDPVNRLATSTVGGVSTRRQYMGDQLVAEYNPATGALTKRYIPGLGLDDVAVAYDGSGTSTRNWQLADERGSVIALSGSTGAVSNINTYDEYGIPGSSNTGRFQYTGQQWLPEAGAYHYRARAYLPEVGRFLQPDPIRYAAGANLYGYVSGDPVNLTDPTGLEPYIEITAEQCTNVYNGEIRKRADGHYWCENASRPSGGPSLTIGGSGSPGTGGSEVIGGGGGGMVGSLGQTDEERERCLSLVRGANRLSEVSTTIGRIGFGVSVAGGLASLTTGPGAAFLVPLTQVTGTSLLITGAVTNITSVGMYGAATGDWGAAAVYGLQTTLTYAGPLGGFGREFFGFAADEFVNRANLMDESACDARI